MITEDTSLFALRSAGEVQTVVRKAVIGAGYDAGTAAEVADAVRWLMDHGYDDGRVGCQVLTGETDPLAALSAVDAALTSQGEQAAVRGGESVGVGVLVTGLCGVAADALHCAFELAGNGWSVVVEAVGVVGTIGPGPFRLRAVPAGEAAPTTGPSGSLPARIAAADWEVLCAAAARTHVPSSQSSRATGAGAGLTDND